MDTRPYKEKYVNRNLHNCTHIRYSRILIKALRYFMCRYDPRAGVLLTTIETLFQV